MKKTFAWFAIGLVTMVSCQKTKIDANYNVVPLPQNIEYAAGESFILDGKTIISYPQGNEALAKTANFLSEYVKDFTDINLKVATDAHGKVIVLKSNLKHDNPDAYQLIVNNDSIVINGASNAGIFYGIQTLRKSIPADSKNNTVVFPSVEIKDYPRFGYRGAMLDVSRHMFPVEFVKKYIDLLALHNINYFHWHLTDDQGWRVEIKKYPELTEKGSIRKETLVGHLLNDLPHEFDGKPYGGYYTQEEVKDIVKYAQDRFISIIPEVDMPGHMLAALNVYPELGCTGGPYEVGTKWGVYDDVLCAGNEKTYEFLEGVFSEIVELFPSKYVHVGGDECPKARWEECPKCQAMIKKLGLKADKNHSAESKLQSYVTSRLEKMLNEKGREIIGWDEMLEGGVSSPNVIILSWRGTEGGIAAAKQKHRAIMAPHYCLYFDYYQGKDTSKEPLSIGGYIPVRNVYDYEPVPSELSEEEAKYILGPQANLWTEYIETPAHAEYMLLPRMGALSEIQWSNPDKKEYQSFLARMQNMIQIYKVKGYNYAKHIFGITADVAPTEAKDATLLTLLTLGGGQIYYTTDGTVPTKESLLYTTPLEISSEGVIKAVAIHADTISDIFEFTSNFNKATYKPVELDTPMNPKYAFNGAPALTDGKIGAASYTDGNWIGFSGKKGMEAIVDLQEKQTIQSVKIGTLNDTPNWIFSASAIKIYGSDDGKNYSLIAEKTLDIVIEGNPIERSVVNIEFAPSEARYVKILLPSTTIPEWHKGKGSSALIFVDEIMIN